MDCPACHHPNVDGARFCAKCGALVPAQTSENSDPYIGQVVGGRFRVLELLGEGGMGRVYLAEQPMGTNVRKVAVKTLHAEHARDENILARFQRECGTVSQLEHPNTIQFFDFGQTPSGDLYIAMEYVEGESLADELEKRGPMSADRVAHIVQQICGSLEEAHQHGIVHRDLKPDNVMLTTRAGQADFVKVLDFGIAKRQEARDAAQEKKLTQQGMVLGTPPYMSPEQFTGKELDARSDIYSLGVMAYEMLTGRLPFDAETPWQWATQHMTAQPFPFEAHGIAEQAPEVMKAAIMKALAKTPDERQASAREFFEEISAAGPARVSATSEERVVTAAMAGLPEGMSGGREQTQLGTPAFATPAPGASPGAYPTGAGQVIPAAPSSSTSKKGGGKGLIIGLGAAAGVLGIIGIVVAARGMKPEDDIPLTNPFTSDTPPPAVAVEAVPTAAMPIASAPEMHIEPPQTTPAAATPAPKPAPAKPAPAAPKATASPTPTSTSTPPPTPAPTPAPTQTAAPALTGDAACIEAKRLADNGDIVRASAVYQNCSGPRAAAAKASIQNNSASAAQREAFRGNCAGARQIVAAATRAGVGTRAAAVVDKECP